MSPSSRFVVFVAVVLLLAACGSPTSTGGSTGNPAVAGPGNAANGDKLFHSATLGKDKVPGCATCHSTEADKTVVGPSLGDIATDAAGAFKEEGYKGKATDGAGWLKEQIVNPNLETVEGFQPNVMPTNYGTELDDSQINDIVAYLLTLK
jgi:nitric oxide reductase subunit C